MGLARIQTYLVLDPGLTYSFPDLFFEEIDSWFTADIACCEQCRDDFVKQWPAIYLHDIEFQKRGISIEQFYKGTAFRQVMTEEDFLERVHKTVRCPRCFQFISGRFWPYNLPFELPEDFEEVVTEIAATAERTPFLILSHPFAAEVFEAIKKAASGSDNLQSLSQLFRARPAADISTPNFISLGPPPAEHTSEGRFNHAGKPVFYAATTPEVAFAEIGAPDDGGYIAEVELIEPLKVFDVSDEALSDDVLRAVFASALVSAPPAGVGWAKPEYVFSRFVADCAFQAGFDAIIYPSAREPKGRNVAVFRKDKEWSDIFRLIDIREYP